MPKLKIWMIIIPLFVIMVPILIFASLYCTNQNVIACDKLNVELNSNYNQLGYVDVQNDIKTSSNIKVVDNINNSNVNVMSKAKISAGAIIGIVIGSLIAGTIVEFIIYWFVIKRRTFADFIDKLKRV